MIAGIIVAAAAGAIVPAEAHHADPDTGIDAINAAIAEIEFRTGPGKPAIGQQRHDGAQQDQEQRQAGADRALWLQENPEQPGQKDK